MSLRLAALVAVLAVSGCTWESRPDGDSPRHLDAARPHPALSPDPVPEAVDVSDAPAAPVLTDDATAGSTAGTTAEAPAGAAPAVAAPAETAAP